MYPILATLQKMSDANSSFGETVGNELWRQCWSGDADAVRKALRGGTDVNEVGNLFVFRMLSDLRFIRRLGRMR